MSQVEPTKPSLTIWPPKFRPPEFSSGVGRRDFMKLMGASLALASFAGCRNRMPSESILPYAKQPEDLILGVPRFYTSTFPMPGFAQGILVESHEGRPTKIEGNPLHPASRGATSYFAQASLLDLYSPFRLRSPERGLLSQPAPSTWLEFKAELQKRKPSAEHKLVVLTGTVTSPTLRRQLDDLVSKSSGAMEWVSYDAVNSDEPYRGLADVYGEPLEAVADFKQARFVLSFDHDFMLSEPGSVANARDYMDARRAHHAKLWMIEPSLSITGSKADRRWARSSPQLLSLARAVLSGLQGAASDETTALIIGELKKARGEALVLAGRAQPAELHSLVAQINEAVGSVGSSLNYRKRQHPSFVAQTEAFAKLVREMQAGRVDTVLSLGGNPAFNAPADLKFAETFRAVPFKVHASLHADETSVLCDWILPDSHFLEAWSDVETADGTVSLVQPMIQPLYSTKSMHEIVEWLAGRETTDYDVLRDSWRAKTSEASWRQALIEGRSSVAIDKPQKFKLKAKPQIAATPATKELIGEMTLELRPDPTIWDGGGSENPWLQELPKPTTQLTWDNALLVPLPLAKKLSLSMGDRVRVTTASGSIEVAALPIEGLPDNALTLHFGYGRSHSGPVAEGSGFNAYTLRTSAQPWRTAISKVEKIDGRYELACTQLHHEFGDRDLIRTVQMESLQNMKPLASGEDSLEDIGRGGLGDIKEEPSSPHLVDQKYQWAMTIDLDSCTGCSACVIACQSENNSPVVGKKMVLMGREMHWIRIDRYAPKTEVERAANSMQIPQPVTCMHCEKAPCEVVCPVAATSHSSDGMNQMIYNRCVGTRYCSNNCPYKVRRFNFFKFADDDHETLMMARNPDVTVRARGVMEKCSYCIQRIERVRQKADVEQRGIRDGEIVTACQQSCPTQAITFGNLLDQKSRVTQKRNDPRTYGLLTDLGTRPRTTYLARVSATPGVTTEATVKE